MGVISQLKKTMGIDNWESQLNFIPTLGTRLNMKGVVLVGVRTVIVVRL